MAAAVSPDGGDARGAPSRRRPRAPQRSRWTTARQILSVLSASLVALVSGTPNAFNAISAEVQHGTDTSALFMSIMTGVGVAGLFISLPAGLLADAYGTPTAALAGSIALVGGYFGMSFSGSSPGLLLLCYSAVGLGSGCTFLAALSAAINTGKAWAVALVSLCMSLSISFTIALVEFYEHHFQCHEHTCWVGVLRCLGLVCAGCLSLGTIGMFLTVREEPLPPSSRARKLSMDGEISCCESLRILRRLDFCLIFVANVAGIGGGVFIVSSIQQVWANFIDDPSLLHYSRTIVVLFSVCNAIGNVASPLVSDSLHQRGRMHRTRFTALVLLGMAANYFILGAFTVTPQLRDGPDWVSIVYMCLMATVGFGYGSSLTLFPTIVSEVYGLRNFGTYVSYVQLGSACISIALPAVTATVFSTVHEYSPMHFSVATLLLLGAACMSVGVFKTNTFGTRKGAYASRSTTTVSHSGSHLSLNDTSSDGESLRLARATLSAELSSGASSASDADPDGAAAAAAALPLLADMSPRTSWRDQFSQRPFAPLPPLHEDVPTVVFQAL